MRSSFFFLFISVSLNGFSGIQNDSPIAIRPGGWEIVFHTGDVDIPVRMVASPEGTFSIVNDDEIISIQSVQWKNDSIHAKLPLFQTFLDCRFTSDSTFCGTFTDHSRNSNYEIPVTGKYTGSKEEVLFPVTKKFDVTFSPDNPDDLYKAVGIFSSDYHSGRLIGTFLTESGDYRYLEGKQMGNSFYLSCFDGSHLFYFSGITDGDSIKNGMFYSGKHWSEPWIAKADDKAELRDPDSLTKIRPDSGPFRFSALNLSRDTINFENDSFCGKVTIVQIFGSWCPNCSDESKFFKELYDQYGSAGLQIIPVAFERSLDWEQRKRAVSEQWKELGIPYPAFLAVYPGKQNPEKTFPMFEQISSFPTCIIIDKHGTVRKIHTGFYGPGTGVYYYNYTDRLNMFVAQLLKEL